ncbi:MAG: PQQ-dependent sugar dehydrogenase [Chlorobiaceae bacterium]|nr:PQQ-dependent sugar dehydrogenase [Chlorobiaceae bacterium]
MKTTAVQSKHRTILRFLLLLPLTITACEIHPAPPPPPIYAEGRRYGTVTIAANLDHPWAIAFLPDGSFLVTERSGRLLKISGDGRNREKITGLPPIVAEEQGGLLDVITDPSFRSNRTIFFSYTAQGPGGTGTEVARAKLTGTRLSELRIIFRAQPKTPVNKHFGSRLLIAPDGKLLITLGEKTEMHQAQNLQNHLGSIIRINPDGTVPEDNPFRHKPGARPEIFTYGNRNVQGIAIHPVSGEIWFHEHGPLGGDELNILKKGANYGWPIVTYGIDYSGSVISDKTEAPGITAPILHWSPCIAPSGMAFYTGDRYPEWKGNLFVGSLVQMHLRRLILNGNKVTGQQEFLRDLHERIRDVRQGPDGFLYLLTDHDNGRLLRIEPPDAPGSPKRLK